MRRSASRTTWVAPERSPASSCSDGGRRVSLPRRWAVFGLYVAAIYASLPFGPRVGLALLRMSSGGWLLGSGLPLLAFVGVGALFVRLIHRGARGSETRSLSRGSVPSGSSGPTCPSTESSRGSPGAPSSPSCRVDLRPLWLPRCCAPSLATPTSSARAPLPAWRRSRVTKLPCFPRTPKAQRALRRARRTREAAGAERSGMPSAKPGDAAPSGGHAAQQGVHPPSLHVDRGDGVPDPRRGAVRGALGRGRRARRRRAAVERAGGLAPRPDPQLDLLHRVGDH